MNLLESIIELIEEGKSIKKICTILCISREDINKELSALANSQNVLNQEKYKHLKIKIKENDLNARAEGARKNKEKNKIAIISNKRSVILELQEEHMTVEEGAASLKMSLETFLAFIKEENQRRPNEVLQRILKQYEIYEYESKDYAHKSFELQKELVMVALAFRVSLESMCKVLQTSPEDLESVYRLFPDLSYALDCLNLETVSESEDLKNMAYHKASTYFRSIKLYKQNLVKAQKSRDSLKIEAYQEKLNTLREAIFDIPCLKLKEKKSLTFEEIHMVLDYRIKYSLSHVSCCSNFPVSIQSIHDYEEQLMQSDETGYYEAKISFLRKTDAENRSLKRKLNEVGK